MKSNPIIAKNRIVEPNTVPCHPYSSVVTGDKLEASN